MNSIESCTWKDERQCNECTNHGVLHCRWKSGDLFLFIALTLPGMLGALAGTLLIGLIQGIWWPLTGYVLFFPVVLGVIETRVLCCHCPFYAQKGIVLHCLANHGLIKIWQYRPGPMNRLEKRIFLGIFMIFMLLPVSILGYDTTYFVANVPQYGYIVPVMFFSLFVVTIMSLVTFAIVMVKNVCSVCINFSCPLNRVEKAHIDAYLNKNPYMRRAWEKKVIKSEKT